MIYIIRALLCLLLLSGTMFAQEKESPFSASAKISVSATVVGTIELITLQDIDIGVVTPSMEFIIAQFNFDLEIIVMLILALSLGGVLGFEREYAGTAAGIRTYGLVALGAAIFTSLSRAGLTPSAGYVLYTSRRAAQLLSVLCFL